MKLQGIYHANPKGFGFVTPEEPDPQGDWFVARHDARGAWDGDTVELLPTDLDRHAGRIAAVLHRANPTVTGVLRRSGRVWYVEPDSSKLTHAIQLTGRARGLSAGLRCAVKVVSYGTGPTPPLATLERLFGPAGTLESAQEAILFRYGVTPIFPEEVEAEAAALPQRVSGGDLAGRTDFRDGCVVTIDSASAKDLDDAVSLTTDRQGHRVLGVHIADVSHYVQPKTALDAEAFERATSVYYVNHVAPMLPTALSNGICSLNPQVDRLTLSCLMTLDDQGNVVDHAIVKGVIRTADRLNYDEVNAFLDGQRPQAGPMTDPAIQALVTALDSLAAQRRKARRQRGALELASGECYFVMDDQGQVADIRRRVSGRGESLIEECMLLANETVAKHLCDNALPGVFRVHEAPSGDKIEGLKHMTAPLGYDLRGGDGFQLQKLVDWARGGPLEGAVSMMVLRALMKARYDGKDLGHFGLAAKHYCHFTSPIRRYPDLVVHRILSTDLAGKSAKMLAGFTVQAAGQSSQREIAAQSAEREIEKLYMAQFMAAHIGETFPGVVAGVTRFGVFVALTSGVEGMVPIEALGDDRWELDEEAQRLVGAHSGVAYQLGAAMEVLCAGADPSTGKIDFTLPGAGITPGISVQNTHTLDSRRGRPTWKKHGGKGFPAKKGRKRSSRR